MSCPDACLTDIRRDRFTAVQRQAPRRQRYGAACRYGLHDVLASGEPGGGLRFWLVKQLPQSEGSLRGPLIQYAHPLAVAEHLAPVMGHPQNRPGEILQKIGQLQLQVPFQIAVQRGKRLVQQNDLRLGAENPRQRHPLLLTAGKLGGIPLFQPLQPKAAEGRRQCGGFFRLGAGADSAEDIFFYRHSGEQGVILE